MNEETIQAARAAFKRDPETACQALLGCSAEEMFVTALRGCNQHKHKPGCPDANGGGVNSADFERILKSYAAKSPEARKQEREAQLKRTLRDYEHAVGEGESDSEVEKLWKDHTDTEALYNALDERLAKKNANGESRSAEMFEKLKHGKHTLPNGDKVSIVNEAINGGRKLLYLDKGGKLELIGRFEKDGYLLPVEGNPYKITRRGGEL